MKNIKRLIFVGLGLLILFLFIYVFLSFGKNGNNKKAENIETRKYFELKDEDLEFVEIEKKGSEPFKIFLKNKDSLNSYGIVGFENVPVNNIDCETVFNFVKKIESNHIFLPKTDLKDYGLKTPSYIFRVKTKSGRDFKIKIGDKTSSGEGYYILLDEKDSRDIAVIDSVKLFPILKDKLGYVELKLIPSYMKTFGDDGKYNKDGVQSLTVCREDLNKNLEFIVDDDGELVVVSPKDFDLTDDVKNSIEKAPASLVAKEAFKIKPTDKDIEDCGLNNPKAYIKYYIDDKKYNIKIGKVSKAEHIPANLEDDKTVNIQKYYYLSIDNFDVIYIVSENLLPWLKF